MKPSIIFKVVTLICCLGLASLSAQDNSKDAEAHYLQAVELLKKDQDRKAITEATQAITIKRDYEKPYWIRGIAYTRLKEFDKAIADFCEVIRLNPTNIDAYKNRAVIYDLKGDKEKALADEETVNKMLAK